MNYDKLVSVVGKILSDPKQEPLGFDELKKMVEESGGDVDHDLFLEEALVELKGRGNVFFDRTTKGNLTNIRWK